MKATRRTALMCMAAALSAVAASPHGQPQYPTQQIRSVRPFPAGGGTDLTSRLLAEQLTRSLGQPVNKMACVRIRHVPYKGAAPQTADVAGKHITMTFVSIGAANPFIESNRIRSIGVTSKTRVSALLDVPAIAEYPPLANFELGNFFGFFGPASRSPSSPGSTPPRLRR